jgi:hypothetical protein
MGVPGRADDARPTRVGIALVPAAGVGVGA